MKLRTRPVEVQGVQWVGGTDIPASGDDPHADNYEPPRYDIGYVRELVGDEGVRESGHGLTVWSAHQEQWLRVPLGHYIVKAADGDLSVYSPESFATNFEVLA